MKNERIISGRITRKKAINGLLDLFSDSPDINYNVQQVFRVLGAKNHPAKMLVLDALNELVLEDYLATDGNGNYRHATRSQVMEGTFQRKKNGRNSFLPDDGGKSILVAERNSMHALDGDRVKIMMLARRQSHAREAEVIEVVERKKDTFVGRLQVERDYGFLITEDRALAVDIFIPKKNLGGGRDGDKVIVKITEWPKESKSPVGKVIEVLGKSGENDAEMHAILAEYNLPYTYPKRVVEAADKIADGCTPEEIARREDFRDVTTFTIDPRDAKDYDDALSIRYIEKMKAYEVGVHIADVTHYIQEGDLLDREAQHRATSIYLVDRTIPMLPERLCNELCSLRQDEEKLTYSTIFHITPEGELLDWHLAKAVIRSNRRFTYEEVQYTLELNGEASEEDLAQPGEHPAPLPKGSSPQGEYAAELIVLNRIAKVLRANRFKHGSIGFDRAEIRFEIDEQGHPVSTYTKVAKDANKLVEEFMLLANRTVAASIANPKVNPRDTNSKGGNKADKMQGKQKAKVLPYRVHDVPDPEKLEKLNSFIGRFGYKLHTDGSKKEVSKSLNKLLNDVKGKNEETMVEMVALRAMQKACYSTHNIGHYGLMFDYYTHFTSPIRRYPDMMVHRLLARYAAGGRSANEQKYEDLCEHSSNMEQLAEQAERASIKYKQVEFLADRIGQQFEGTINGVTEFGFYVQLDDNGCEGMVPLRDLLDDYYEFDEKNFCLSGRRFRKRYSLGDKVTVRVERANLDRRQLDFGIIEEYPQNQPAFTSPVLKKKQEKRSRRK